MTLRQLLKKRKFAVKSYEAAMRLLGLSRSFLRSVKNYKAHQSYSQCGEDLIIDYIFKNYLRIAAPSYLDIGAHHPSYFSNTYLFYQQGCRGVCVEPDPYLYSAIRKKRRNDICINAGIGFSQETVADFYIMSERTLNTFSKEQAEYYQNNTRHRISKVIPVPLLSANDIISNYFSGSCPNLVSLDVEGLDFEILKSFNFATYRPQVFCIETITYAEDKTERKLSEITDYMKDMGYFVYADTYINTIFIDKETWIKRP